MTKNNMIKDKKGISPVIATVLLIVVVLVLGTAIFIWAISVKGDEILKFGDDISLACGDVDMSASYADGELYVTNEANVPIDSIRIKTIDGDVFESGEISIAAGRSAIIEVDDEPTSVFPVLLGKNKKGGNEQTYACDNEFFVD